MVVDCRDPKLLKGRYFDSLNRRPNDKCINQVIARYNLQWLATLFNEQGIHYGDFSLRVDPHTPLQARDNYAGREEAGSACGPFVWLIAKEVAQYIVECNEDGKT
ncbi:hypothetical protein EK21DRAFT_113035 [Setomelanomma holmii]|uniref:Uncharacterized protein n=1 Tax=Setomelanomma holmii TaxID=210430 RepID=A0A9P4H8V4_9PLEO|nr:hypothetical protein EK21DRAFT_113035 [Setomelanomma holmii]